MKINADFSRRAAVHAAQVDWVPSPMAGVERKMLDRIGDEVARATTIVRFAPGSRFSPHVHDRGEEFLVLDGVFQDESGDFPAGTYVRNPPTSRHAPMSAPGCTIFVKLRQFAADDRRRVTLNTTALALETCPDRPGVTAAVVFANARETVRIEQWAPGTRVAVSAPGGIEMLCLEGSFTEGDERFARWSWLRLPVGAALNATAGARGCRVWIKEGHLRFVHDDHRRGTHRGAADPARPSSVRTVPFTEG